MHSEAISLLKESQNFILSKCGASFRPEWAVLLGSGLENIVREARIFHSIPYSEIPGFSDTTVAGHQGRFICCDLFGKSVVILSGRLHFYEGHSMEQIIFSSRLMGFLGAKKILLTAAAGGINKKFRPGDIVVVKDHLNFMGHNPLCGPHDSAFGERFPDMSAVYSEKLRAAALAAAKKSKIRAFPGIYTAVSGPSYETPAEVKAFEKIGGDVVGMSVVPEAIVAVQMGMDVLAVSYVANMAAGINKKPLSHAEVLEQGKKTSHNMSVIIRGVLQNKK